MVIFSSSICVHMTETEGISIQTLNLAVNVYAHMHSYPEYFVRNIQKKKNVI